VAALTDTPPLRGAVLGVGMIGRHHARLLQSSPRVRFAGAVDPGGDRFAAVRDPALLFIDTASLLAAGPVDFAIVAVPTEEHLGAVRRLAAEGVHLLVEKPLAASTDEARELIAVCEQAGIRAAVGHVERFNPALLELRRRTQSGQLGDVFLIATERVGLFPDRIRDVGVSRTSRPTISTSCAGSAMRRSRGSRRRPSTGWIASTRTWCW
jgi:UDP-N-acetylglucosamine 3-dehydrogenase